MLSVSNNFLISARANPRKCKAKLDIIWTDPTIDSSIIASANDENRAAILSQVYDGNTDTSKKWAHLDGEIKADGTYYAMPVTSEDGQVGWYGSTSCDSNGEWVTNPELTLVFDERPVVTLLVTGDSVYNEYPVDFDVLLYSGVGGAVLEYTETVVNNTNVIWNKNISEQNLTNITKMILEIKKWSEPLRIVKITEAYTSFAQTFENEDIVRLNLLEERVLSDGSLPVGNISANEIDLTLQNIKINYDSIDYIDPFYPANPNSLYYNLLKKNRKIIPYIGFVLADNSVEYVKLGTFWTGDWQVNEQSPVCSVSARDRMELLRLSEFEGSTLYQNTSLYDLADIILTDAKTSIPMIDLEWEIDTELQDFIIPYAWFPKKSYFNTIKDIIEACMGQAYMNREDVLIIEGPTTLTT